MKRHWKKRLLALFLTLTMMLSLVPGAFAREDDGRAQGLSWSEVGNDAVSASLRREEVQEPEEKPLYNADEEVRVSIVLEAAPTLATYSVNGGLDAGARKYRADLLDEQKTVAERISEDVLDKPLDVVSNLTLAVNIISANVAYGQIDEIEALDYVKDVIVETRYEIQGKKVPADPNLIISTGMTNTVQAWGEGYTGAGMRIAIIDTGLDIYHQSFNNDAFLYALNEDAAADGKTVSSYDLLDTDEISSVLTDLNAYDRYKGILTASDLYRSEKLPYCFNYVDKDLDVTHENDSASDHGSHVAGISAANRYLKQGNGYVNAFDAVKMTGNAPDAQVLVMKVFGKGGGAYDSDYFAAIEDAIVLGCDTVNLSLGSSSAGMTTSDSFQAIMENLADTDTVVTISAGNNSHWAEQTYPGLPYSEDVNFHTGGSPGSFTNSLAVASVDNNGMVVPVTLSILDRTVVFAETNGYANVPLATMDTNGKGATYDFVYLDAIGTPEDFAKVDVSGKVAMFNRGTTSFFEKGNAAGDAGAIGAILCNNAAGLINMNLAGLTYNIPYVSITLADAEYIKANAEEHTSDGLTYYTGKLTVINDSAIIPGADDYETMSEFTSWGAPGDLSMKPEITAPGGNIWSLLGTSASHDQYQSMSGTSMAAPQMAGIGALIKQRIESEGLSTKTSITDRALAQSLLMSTAVPLKDENGAYYSVLQQGAGMADTNAAVNADSYILMDSTATDSWKDGKVKVELGDGKNSTYTVSFTINNLDGVKHGYTLDADVFTQRLVSDQNGNAYLHTSTMPLGATVDWTWDGKTTGGGTLYDFNGDGLANLKDGDTLLDVATGLRTRDSLSNQDLLANFRTGNNISSYTGYEFLQQLGESTGELTVPANGSVTVTATITLDPADVAKMMANCPNGFYVEAYLYASSIATEEGVLGTNHSIPVLGFYGNWTDASMFDKGNYEDYLASGYLGYPLPPYMTSFDTEDGTVITRSLIRNYLLLQSGGESNLYYFGGNPYLDEENYRPERNAMNNTKGDMLTKWYFTVIRNAVDSRMQIRDKETGTIYAETTPGPFDAAYYSANQGGWMMDSYNLPINWRGTDASGAALPEGTTVELSLTLAPELYANADGSVNWSALGRGATQTMQLTIDNTAPVLGEGADAPKYDEETKELTITATDNQYIAAVLLTNDSGTTVLAAETPDQLTTNTTASVTLDLSGVVGKGFYIVVADYAGNETTYRFEQTLVSDVDAYYSGYEPTSKSWVSYTSDGSKSATINAGSPAICAGAYAKGYVFAFDTDNNFYTFDATTPGVLGDAVRVVPKGGLGVSRIMQVDDMAYDQATDTMYLLYTSGQKQIGTIDLTTGKITPLVDSGDFTEAVSPTEMFAEPYAIAVNEGTIYAVYYSMTHNFSPWLASFTVNEGSIENFTDIGGIGVATMSGNSMTWDSAKNELALSTRSGIYKVDPATATATAVSGTKQVAALFTAPAADVEVFPVSDEATEIYLSDDEQSLLIGARYTLDCSVLPWNMSDRSVTWTSSDPSVATVSSNGLVTAEGMGTTMITVTSNQTPSVEATCMVTVKALSVDLEGIVWESDNRPYWTSFNTASVSEYVEGQGVECGREFQSGAMTEDGEIYANTITNDGSDFYRIDPETKAVTLLSASSTMQVSDITVAPNLTNKLMGVSGSYMVTIDKTTGEVVEAFWDTEMFEDGGTLVAIAYEGSDMYGNDFYLMIDSDGDLYEQACMEIDGETWCGIAPGTALLGNTGYSTNGAWYMNSAVVADDEDGNPYLIWSRYESGAASSDIIAIDFFGSGFTSRQGAFPQNIWPVTALMGSSTDVRLLENVPAIDMANVFRLDPSETDLAAADIEEAGEDAEDMMTPDFEDFTEPDEGETVDPAESTDPVDTEEPGESDDGGDEQIPDGELETLSHSVTSNCISTVNNFGKVTVQVTLHEASTNGMIEVNYNANDLQLVAVNGKATLNSANTTEDGTILLAYAYKTAAANGTTVAELTFNSKNMRSTTITLTTLEVGSDKRNDSEVVPVTFTDPGSTGGGSIGSGGTGGSTGGGSSKPSKPSEPAKPDEPVGPTQPTTPTPGSTTVTVPAAPTAGQVDEIIASYTDVNPGDWYADYAAYMINSGLMSGTDASTFAPNESLTRGMLVTILHRIAGLPAAGSASFADVVSGSWYATGVAWASGIGLVKGYDDSTFRPDGNITRQELAVILWRFAQQVGISVAANGTTIPDFADRGEIAPWAGEAMSWAYRTGIITGRDSTHLAPNGGASRAETAAMLVRFLNLVTANQNPMN